MLPAASWGPGRLESCHEGMALLALGKGRLLHPRTRPLLPKSLIPILPPPEP